MIKKSTTSCGALYDIDRYEVSMLSIHSIDKFPKGTIESLLIDSYSAFHTAFPEFENNNLTKFKECDEFFYINLDTGKSCSFISSLENEVAGMCCWDPRQYPIAEIGHNCIKPALKGKGLGKEQMQYAIDLLIKKGFTRIKVSTGLRPFFLPARRMYESVGFKESNRDDINDTLPFHKIYYEFEVKN